MDRQKFFDALRKTEIFPRLSQSQVNGIEGIIDAFATHGDGSKKTLAYALATAYHETGSRMVPVREGFGESEAAAIRAVQVLAKKRGPNSAPAKYVKPVGPYNKVYLGRGHVQLTWLENYERSSKDAGVDLVKNPEAMLDPVISARVLIKGLIDGRWNGQGKGIGFYLPVNGKDDLRNARRTVNITDKWQLIGDYYKIFLAAIDAAGEFAPKAEVVKPETPKPSTDTKQTHWLESLINILAKLFKGGK